MTTNPASVACEIAPRIPRAIIVRREINKFSAVREKALQAGSNRAENRVPHFALSNYGYSTSQVCFQGTRGCKSLRVRLGSGLANMQNPCVANYRSHWLGNAYHNGENLAPPFVHVSSYWHRTVFGSVHGPTDAAWVYSRFAFGRIIQTPTGKNHRRKKVPTYL